MGKAGGIVAIASIGLAAVAAGCSGGDNSGPTTTLDVMGIIQDSGPYRCADELSSVVATMMDTQNLQLARDMWGSPSPATEFAMNLYGVLTSVRYREGVPVAAEQLTEYSTSACFDGDIANDVTRAQPGEDGYVSACLDGHVPQPGDALCVAQPPTVATTNRQPAPSTRPTTAAPDGPPSSQTQNTVPPGEASLPGISDGAPAPWETSVRAANAGLTELVEAVREDEKLAACPFIWPVDPLVEPDGTGEGLSGFLTWGLAINIQTPGGNDYGGASIWVDGNAPFDTAFEPGAVVERYVLANGDVLELAWGQSNYARITVAGSDCVWSFGAGSGYGLEVIVRSLATIT